MGDLVRAHHYSHDGDDISPPPSSVQPSVVSMCSVTEERMAQSLENTFQVSTDFVCAHVSPKKKRKIHENNMESNRIYCSWAFHQYFDGLSSLSQPALMRVPRIKLSVDRSIPVESLDNGRQRCHVIIEYLTAEMASGTMFELREPCLRLSDTCFRTVIDVGDVDIFEDCLNYKYSLPIKNRLLPKGCKIDEAWRLYRQSQN